jgi:hypothetical protein
MAPPKVKNISTIGAHYDAGRVAALLDMSVRWVKARIQQGELEGYRLGHKVVVSEASLRAFLERHQMHKSDEPDPDSAA